MAKQGSTRFIITSAIDSFIEALNKNLQLEDSRWGFHLMLILINLLMSTFNIVLMFKIGASGSGHIVFWLGEMTVYINLAVPILLTEVSLHLFFLNMCQCKKSTVQVIIYANFATAGLLLIAGSIYVLVQAIIVYNELVYSCGSGKMTRRMESEWNHLIEFQKHCAEVMNRDEGDIFIQECPGFDDLAHGSHGHYVDYIEDVEYDYGCQGFCEFWSRPLFNEDATTGQRCASAIGEDVLETGLWIAVPTLFSGWITFVIGQVLGQYDGL
jgi:hypothetical protein